MQRHFCRHGSTRHSAADSSERLTWKIITGDRPMLPNSFHRYSPLVVPLLVGLMLACPHAVAQATPEPIYSSQADAQAASKRGYHALLTVPLESAVITEQQYFDLWQYWPEPEGSKAAAATPDQRRQMMLERYGFQESPDRPGPVPQQFTSDGRSEEHTSELQSHHDLVCRL